MANWLQTIDLSDAWETGDLVTISLEIANRLEKLKPLPLTYGWTKRNQIGKQRNNLIKTFRALAEDPTVTDEDFNNEMDNLYDWADQGLDGDWNGAKVCWIER